MTTVGPLPDSPRALDGVDQRPVQRASDSHDHDRAGGLRRSGGRTGRRCRPGRQTRGPAVAGRSPAFFGNSLEDRELQKRIDARRYPTINGVLEAIEQANSDSCYRVTGTVTFRGKARRHQGEMSIRRLDDDTVTLAGQSRFDIRDFGMEPPRFLMLKVDPQVEVAVDIIARKEP